MEQLTGFAGMEPPCLLWRCNGRFADIFRFAALRFRCVPDHVLDCESVHARWKWLEWTRRNIKFKLLNAMLKLSQHLRDNGGQFPANAVLAPYMSDIRAGLREQVRQLCADGVPRAVDRVHWDRFNLRVTDVDLLKSRTAAKPAIHSHTPDIAWSNYVRYLFEPNTFYSFANLRPGMYLFVAENKSFAGRDPRAAGEALGRALSVC
eukprot:3307386-Pyramimonas_sp.AAC.1